MGKRFKQEVHPAAQHAGLDMTDMINKMLQQMAVLEKKIDTLIGRPFSAAVETRPFSGTFNRPGQANSGSGVRQISPYRDRIMHKAVCADCRKECEVPFKPSGERPVYCKECFSKRKSARPFKDRPDNRPGNAGSVRPERFDKPHSAEKKRHSEKKVRNRKRSKGKR